MAVAHEPYIPPEEYLEVERQAETKSEYYQGQVYAMAGASPNHVFITVNTCSTLRQQLRGKGCRVGASDMRVKVEANGLYTYPDVVVAYGEMEFDDGRRDTLLNPTLLVEVLSPSTELYDRGAKFAMYRGLPSLQQYVLVTQDRPMVECYTRREDGTWLLAIAEGMDDNLELSSVGCTLRLSDVYEDIDFTQPSA